MSNKGKLFYAKAVKGHTIKVLIDSLSQPFSRTVFTFNKDGIFHRNADEVKQILFDVAFYRKHFQNYVCKEEIVFDVNLNHLQTMLKNVKKKDTLILFIDKETPKKLAVTICPSNTNGSSKSQETITIAINRIEEEPQQIELPEIYHNVTTQEDIPVYSYPVIIDSSAFGKMKKMTSIGKVISVNIQRGNYIIFGADNGELYNTTFEFGEIYPNEEFDEEDKDLVIDGQEEDNKEKGWYEAEFDMNIFKLLMKLPGLCKQMQFYAPKNRMFPLKIGMQADNFGDITIYIKNKQMVDIEQNEREQIQAEKIKKTKKKKSVKK